MRGGCLLSGIIILLDGFLFIFLFAPLFFADTAFAEQSKRVQASLLCGENDTYAVETYKASYHEPGEVGVLFLCVDAEGKETDVTGGFIVIVLVAFIVPFFLLLFLGLRGASKTVNTALAGQGAMIQGSGQPISPDSQAKLWEMRAGAVFNHMMNSATASNVPSNDKSLAEQLQELQEAYNKNLITREEYDQLRQRIINNATD
jgi:hypothetical protein